MSGSFCLFCGREAHKKNIVCFACLDDVKQGRGPSERFLRWWCSWGINEAGIPVSFELSDNDLVLIQPELRYVLDNWTAALRTDSVDGPQVKWLDINKAIRYKQGLVLWCRRFDPHPGPGGK